MQRKIPEPCFQCDHCQENGNDTTCYPREMIGYLAHRNMWICSFCAEDSGDDDLLGFHWDENDEPAYRHEWPSETDKEPAAYYCCAWDDCGADITFRPEHLRWEEDGFYCHYHLHDKKGILDDVIRFELPPPHGPTLAEVLRAQEKEKSNLYLEVPPHTRG